jgi:prevent-host-death family protein
MAGRVVVRLLFCHNLSRLTRQMHWQLQTAKQRFSELVRRALDEGPQTVTRHGHDVVVVVSAADYRHLAGVAPDLKSFLLASPDLSPLELDGVERDLPRAIDL